MSDDGQRIVSAAGDGTIAQLWDLGLLQVLRPRQKEMFEAWARLRANPRDAQAARTCAQWYAEAQRFDLAQRTLREANLESTPEAVLLGARVLWLDGRPTDAALAFHTLRDQSSDLWIKQYLALCAFAADSETKR
jgi:hypothetical protein